LPGGLYKFTDQNNEPVKIALNGVDVVVTPVDGYVVISRNWKAGDKISLDIPMPVRQVVADEKIKEDKDKIAVQRGPVIYAAEWPDNNNGNILNIMVRRNAVFTTEFLPALLEGTQVIKTLGYQTRRTLKGKVEILAEEVVTLIPYALWNNRGAGQMMVWLPSSTESTRPLPAPTIAFRSEVLASKASRDLKAVNDQLGPSNSNDHSVLYYHWWPEKNKWEWIQYDFDKPQTISKTKVYWFDDGPDGGCRIPDDWEVLYLNDNVWEPVIGKTPYKVTKDGWDSLMFKPVRTSKVKLKVKLNKEYASGIYEWIVE